ncbi:MAG TPA: helix-turn-helix transcriptional regulator [Flavisolibacter sp.]|nr:helix-turn-helix transcriptional regulator [Flavisolibacter sp.]
MQWIYQNRWQQNAVPHKHNYFVLIWVKKGAGVQLVDLNRFELTDNTVYCITPGQVHLLKADENVDGCVISFTADFLSASDENYNLLYNSGLFYTYAESSLINVTPDMQEELEGVALKMQKEFENFFLLRAEILRGYLKIFLIYLTRQFNQSHKDAYPSRGVELTKHFFRLLEKNFITKKMVADYARELTVTPNYLNEIVKKVSGFPASDHIRQRVVLEAKRQAVYADVSMKEIAYALGFDDIAHFSKYFKKATGSNFTDFKKAAIEQLGQ